MDKVIIDKVNVSECPFYEYQTEEDYEMRYPESGYCEIGLAGYLFNYSRITEEIEKDCIDNHNCFFKQLQRLQQENEELKKQYSFSTILKIDKLEQENERLKEEVEHYRKEAYRLADGLNKTENLAFTYKQALQEIRELIKKLDLSLGCAYGDYDCDNCSDINEETVCKIKLQNIILDKINSVIGAEE